MKLSSANFLERTARDRFDIISDVTRDCLTLNPTLFVRKPNGKSAVAVFLLKTPNRSRSERHSTVHRAAESRWRIRTVNRGDRAWETDCVRIASYRQSNKI